MPRIFFTGGGTAGHVTPNIALIESLQADGWECHYVGAKNGIEQTLIQPLNIPFYGIHSGKLRRYFSWQNFIDPLFIILGWLQSVWLCLRHRPQIIFSKGGFVAVPVAVAAWLCRIPVISHESDITPGLANKLCLPFSRKLCVNFSETVNYLPASARARTLVTGSPLRAGLRNTDARRGERFLGQVSSLPLLLVVGGSLGAKAINETIWANLDWLLAKFQVVHLVGGGNVKQGLDRSGYWQFEYLGEAYGDVLARADLVISRAGANSVYELLAFQKPHLLIPLTAAASRGDQLVNARIMKERGLSLVLQESELNSERLETILEQLLQDSSLRAAMSKLPKLDAIRTITDLIRELVKKTA